MTRAVPSAIAGALLVGVASTAALHGPASRPAGPSPLPQPLAAFTTHVVATHYLAGRAYETHHYLKPIADGVLQGLVFRETTDGSPLVEVEWAITKARYDSLPAWQQQHWHPLFPAVDGGRVRLPDLPPGEERNMLATARTLYAQTINLAGLDGELPTGLQGIAMVTHLTPDETRRLMTAGLGPMR